MDFKKIGDYFLLLLKFTVNVYINLIFNVFLNIWKKSMAEENESIRAFISWI